METVVSSKFYGLKNDLMFHVVMQECPDALTALVSSLTGTPKEDIRDCHVENPIDYGKGIDLKTVILDVRLTLNNGGPVNIELQIWREKYWPERSLLYWGRTYDILHSGDDYDKLRPTYHIGILGFTLFEDAPEFFSDYRIYNTKNGRLYTDKLIINVLDLTRTDLAENDPKEQELLKWATLFNAGSLEEFEKLAAGEEEVFRRMAVTLKKLNQDEKMRLECEARERYDRDLRSQYIGGYEDGVEAMNKEVEEQRARADAATARADSEKNRADDAIARADSEKNRADAATARADIAEAELRQLRSRLAAFEAGEMPV